MWKAGLLLAVGAAGGGAALAVASVPGSDGVIHACLLTTTSDGTPATYANVRVIDTSAGQVCNTVPISDGIGEAPLSWNARGPRGLPGKSVTVAGGHTLTLKAGVVVTVGSSEGLTITTPTLTPKSKPIGFVEFGGGLKFPLYSYDVAGKGSSGGASGGGSGRASLDDIRITKYVDKASPLLFRYCSKGTHIPNGTIVLRKAGKPQQEYLKIKMTDLIITSYQTSGGGGGDRPTESLTLNFTKVEYKYTKQ